MQPSLIVQTNKEAIVAGAFMVKLLLQNFQRLKNRGGFENRSFYIHEENFPNAQAVKRLLLVREVWGSNPEPIKSPTRCHWHATVATLKCGP